jgi:CO/xanthine dehydrogenase FAD-binding subunit
VAFFHRGEQALTLWTSTQIPHLVRTLNGVIPLGDIHASLDVRAHLARVNTRRALRRALER